MTRFEEFTNSFKEAREFDRVEEWKKPLIDNGTYKFSDDLKKLSQFQNNLSRETMVYMFGEQLGDHLWEKFVHQSGRNLLRLLPTLTDEYRFFILHEFRNNPNVFFYG